MSSHHISKTKEVSNLVSMLFHILSTKDLVVSASALSMMMAAVSLASNDSKGMLRKQLDVINKMISDYPHKLPSELVKEIENFKKSPIDDQNAPALALCRYVATLDPDTALEALSNTLLGYMGANNTSLESFKLYTDCLDASYQKLLDPNSDIEPQLDTIKEKIETKITLKTTSQDIPDTVMVLDATSASEMCEKQRHGTLSAIVEVLDSLLNEEPDDVHRCAIIHHLSRHSTIPSTSASTSLH